MVLAVVALVLAADPTFCDERPSAGAPASRGRPSRGSVEGAIALSEGPAVRVLPRRHRRRCLTWATPRLVGALERAGQEVQRALPGSPPLGVGNLGRARGGSLAPYSKSHQAGRDADLAFYALDAKGPVALDDLVHFGADLKSEEGHRFDVERNWALVAALVSDESIELEWLFVSSALKEALLAQGRKVKAPAAVLAAAERALHQPSDAPPHDNHFHVRVRCTPGERAQGCVD